MHCDDGNASTRAHRIVTACLDRLDLTYPLTLGMEHDLVLEGNASWTGRSALEIEVRLRLKDDPTPKLTATTVFVAVNDKGKGVTINPLEPATPEDRKMFEAGNAANARRKEERAKSLKTLQPTEEEVGKLHAVSLRASAARGTLRFAGADSAPLRTNRS
jgi:acyl-coenzyme A thioesterase 9